MNEFLKYMYRQGRVSDDQLQTLVTNGKITQEQYNEIKASKLEI